MPNRKIHVVGGSERTSEAEVFLERGRFDYVTQVRDADILILRGGHDIGTELYHEATITNRPWYSEERDRMELAALEANPTAFRFGICRGGQLLNVLAGGKLWQDVNGHHTDHMILDQATGRHVWSSSVHHQAFRVAPGAEIIATCEVSTYKQAEAVLWRPGVHLDEPTVDVEVAFYAGQRSLCIQGHPEYRDVAFADYCFNLMEARY